MGKFLTKICWKIDMVNGLSLDVFAKSKKQVSLSLEYKLLAFCFDYFIKLLFYFCFSLFYF